MPSLQTLTLIARLIVETGSPDALCPDLASTEQAVRARLGELEAGDAANWRLRYTIGHAPNETSGDFVRLELYDPENELRLSRNLPLAGESCATMARVIALVVDRFFRAMVAEHDASPPKAAPPHEPAPAPAAGTAESSLTARAGVVFPPFSPTLGLFFTQRTNVAFSLTAGLSWIVLPTTEELERGGEARSRSAALRISPAWALGLGSTWLALGPVFSIGAERASTSGVPETDVKYRAVATAGAEACFHFRLGESLRLELLAGGEAPFRPFGGQFVVDGEHVLQPPDFRAFFGIGLGPAW